MEIIESQKLIEHIEEAKDWLDQAKDEYNSANPIRGGLILNLAQAEVKHAWELSHHQFVSKSINKPAQRRNWIYLIPIAASLVLFTSLVVGVRVGGNLIAFKSLPFIAKASIISKENFRPTSLDKSNLSLKNSLQDRVQVAKETLVSNNSVSQIGSLDRIGAQVASIKATSSIRITGSQLEHSGQESAVRQPVLKPVFKLSIDEEDLTKEASHSLRNGK